MAQRSATWRLELLKPDSLTRLRPAAAAAFIAFH
jgi:hypothetical protein